jgi:hypothetical protein
MKDEKLVTDGLKLILKGMGEETPQQPTPTADLGQKAKPLSRQQAVFITGIICAGLVAVFFAGSLINIVNQNDILFSRERNAAMELSDTVMTAIRYPMMTGDQDVIQLQFEQFKDLKGIREMQLMEHTGIVKRATDRNLINKKLEVRTEQIAIENNINAALDGKSFAGLERMRGGSGLVFTVLKPIINERSCKSCHGGRVERLGVLRIVLDWTSSERAMQATQQQNKLFAIAAIMIMGILVFSVLKYHSK